MRKVSMLRMTLTVLLMGAPAAATQWPSDPALNLAIADHGTGEQTLPKIAATPDGGCYIGWFDNSYSGNYDVHVQRLDAAGAEVWPHDGICVSNHPQDTWLTEWDLIADSQGNCIVAFNDFRNGAGWDVFAYKISPDGLPLWGVDGQPLSCGNPIDEATPCLVEASDGDIVVAWMLLGDSGGIQMQRLAPDGTWRYPAGPITVVAPPGTEIPAFPDVVPSLDGSVIVSYVSDISTFMSPRHFMAQRYAADGAPVWASPLAIMDEAALPMGYSPTIAADGAGGLITAWQGSIGDFIFSSAQRIDAAGTELWPHNGLRVSVITTEHMIDPSYSYDPVEGLLYVFWNQRNWYQSRYGIYGQKFSPSGERSWTELGLTVLPLSPINKSYPRTLQLGSDVILFVADQPDGYGMGDRIRAWRMTPAGVNAWSEAVTVSSVSSMKGSFPVTINDAGMSVIVWDDDRTGLIDIYGQNINADGTLGASSGAVIPGGSLFAISLACTPNPSSSVATFQWMIPASAQATNLIITDPAGRLVQRIRLAAGNSAMTWDGRDAAGNAVPSGVYLARLESAGEPGAMVRFVHMR